MNHFNIWLVFSLLSLTSSLAAQNVFESDTISTPPAQIKISFVGHASLFIHYNDRIIHIDPVGSYGDYSKMPKADLILVTHHHGDHFNQKAIGEITKPGTVLILTETCGRDFPKGIVMKNGDVKQVLGIKLEAVPAYNIVHKRDNGEPFHPRGEGNGYVLNLTGKKIYIAGDTENIPEMKNLNGIDCAFLPMNLPYTMTPEMVAQAVRLFHPKILYPYHFGDTNVQKLVDLLKDDKSCEVRIRKMK